MFRVYSDPSDTVDEDDDAAIPVPRPSLKIKSSNIHKLLMNDDDEEGGEGDGSIA